MNRRSAWLSGHHDYAPKYVDLAQTLLRHIASEQLRPGQRLGTEHELVQKHGVSRVTVRQALAILEKEGFISREKARGTFVRRSIQSSQQLSLVRGSVAVVCSNEQASHVDEDFAFATVLRGIERTLARQGFTVQILGLGADERTDRVRLEQLASRQDLEGICTIGPCLEPYRDLVGRVPIVYSCCFYAENVPLVRQDVREVTRESVQYLVERGHRNIALLCGSWVDQKAFAIFVDGYREVFKAAGLPVNRSLLLHAHPGEPLERLATEVLSTARPTAIFAENWRICGAVLTAAMQLDLRIPGDLSVIAYGQNVLQIASPVQITTYVPDSNRTGELAGETLVAMIEGKSPPTEPLGVPGTLIERGSVGFVERAEQHAVGRTAER